jgi:hypothetical protein
MWGYLINMSPFDLHLMDIYLLGTHFMGMYRMGTHFMGMYRMGIHFMGVYLLWACISWVHSAGRWVLMLSF